MIAAKFCLSVIFAFLFLEVSNAAPCLSCLGAGVAPCLGAAGVAPCFAGGLPPCGAAAPACVANAFAPLQLSLPSCLPPPPMPLPIPSCLPASIPLQGCSTFSYLPIC
ncbi:hypothetical protein Phum_PHUM146600 [Pediculus humanus corporis]|uniref:Uncharacterized protein n=1 Tax=Pediculus humanus subsp. corporis TaxID=121224 RepID=E0VEY1_PEDHC|nr:uncharacterized protein Phum_PHUM146600 [Pediculus humanus corporis]EEB11955.1 hypothetical protein Phum_PHUM146600 [Pediculus humanus corporis]